MLRVLVLLWLTVLLTACGPPSGSTSPTPEQASAIEPDIAIANANAPGEELDLSQARVKGKTTLFEFYSVSCPACVQMEPIMDYLSRGKENLAIRKVNIDRPGADGIDFDSPLAEQWQVESVPSFRIVDGDGRLLAQGKEAKDQVREWYSQAQMVERAQSSELSEPYLATPSP